jgi:hypothetical protein
MNNQSGLLKKFKEFYDNKYGMLIIVSWAVLIICWLIKLFGGNWFELGTENIKFINFCNFVDNTKWLKIILACLIYLFTTYPVLCCILNKKYLNTKLLIIFMPLMIIKSITGWYILWIAYIIDLFIIVILPLIICKFKNWRRVVLGNVLVLSFQLLTMAIRNIGVGLNSNNTFIEQALIQVDYYIMIMLFYLYNFRRERGK